jgi:hypothetical protein
MYVVLELASADAVPQLHGTGFAVARWRIVTAIKEREMYP